MSYFRYLLPLGYNEKGEMVVMSRDGEWFMLDYTYEIHNVTVNNMWSVQILLQIHHEYTLYLSLAGYLKPKEICDKESRLTFMQTINIVMHYLLQDENMIVNGINIISDCSHLTVSHQKIWSVSDYKRLSRLFKVQYETFI